MIRIIGIGSPFGEDVIGIRVAEALAAGKLPKRFAQLDTRICTADRPGPGLLELMADTDHVILVDAMISGERPGTGHWLAPEQIPEGSAGSSSHGFGLAQALALGRSLGRLPARVEIYAIEIRSAGLSSLAPGSDNAREHAVVQRAVSDILQRLHELAND